MLKTPDMRLKRAYDPPAAADGARILVDRLWPRGLSKDAAQLSAWLKDVAPSPELRKWFGHDPARWAEFSRRYRAELSANDAAVAQLRAYMKSGPVTLLYAAHDTEHNHARVLADFLRHRPAPRSAERPRGQTISAPQPRRSAAPHRPGRGGRAKSGANARGP
jgi:uncharacterized protein YeaO (DUF488 family)